VDGLGRGGTTLVDLPMGGGESVTEPTEYVPRIEAYPLECLGGGGISDESTPLARGSDEKSSR
jgi:hypothetical protein